MPRFRSKPIWPINGKMMAPDSFGATQFEVLSSQLYAQTGPFRRSQTDAFNPMRFVNDVASQVQLLIVYGKGQVGKSSGEMSERFTDLLGDQEIARYVTRWVVERFAGRKRPAYIHKPLRG